MNKSQLKWIVQVIVVVIAVLFFTNPDQATHLKAIKDTLKLRNASADPDTLLRITDYNNYIIFSTTSLGGITYTRGYLGRIEVTDNIKLLDGIPIK